MCIHSASLDVKRLAVCWIIFFQMGCNMNASLTPQRAEASGVGPSAMSVVVRTDHEKYTLNGILKLDAFLQNNGDSPVYVDRRMFWTGLGGGLKLVITDEEDKPLPARGLSDAIMPPPKEGDTSILIRLEQGFFYGTSLRLVVKDFFPRPGRYSIRVVYKSMLPKELVEPQLQNLPAIWADASEIVSAPVWIEVNR